MSKKLSIRMVGFVLLYQAIAGFAQAPSPAPAITSAWHDGRFQVDVPGVIGRSDIVLEKPNLESVQAMPLGNGRLGVAVWSADGVTAQLNRNDTLPDRLSPGKVIIPGLGLLTHAKDYSGRLDLYHGEFRERGGGMTATAYVEPDNDVLIVDVTGADPATLQTAILRLWAPRTPQALARNGMGLLAQAWVDNKNPGFSGRAFGSISAITAHGRSVSAVVTDPLTVTVSFRPYADGRFQIVVASPHYDGKANIEEIAAGAALLAQPIDSHKNFWKDFWNRAAIIKISSPDGAGEYMENLRNIYLYIAAIEKGVEYPGSHAGMADMMSSVQDSRRWDPSAFWHWNLRMQVAANIGAGLTDLNGPYFNLYRENLTNIENWTKEHMHGLGGICVPETMRFNGRGIENESNPNPFDVALDCDANFAPYYNARTLSTGSEVSLWVWQQFLATNDREFLAENYPLMAASARFLLAYQKMGADGQLHTSPSNAHEQQWDVTDPATDIAAISALYPATIQAGTLLGKDADLIRQLQAALPEVPPLPRARQADPHTLAASTDTAGEDVIAESWTPGAAEHNFENIGLEPVWPYNLTGDTSPLFALARRTYYHRPNPVNTDWGSDPIQAARLQLNAEVGSTLIAITQKFQKFVNGMAQFEPNSKEFYVEQTGVVADALQEALVQDYDGVIRVAPAIPPAWDFEGSVYVRGNTKVDVQTHNGAVVTLVIEAGTAGAIKLRNPWPGKPVDVISGNTGKEMMPSSGNNGSEIEFTATGGTSYLIKNHDDPIAGDRFAPVSGTPSSSPKYLGPVQIGLSR